jgi:hypothetical protein
MCMRCDCTYVCFELTQYIVERVGRPSASTLHQKDRFHCARQQTRPTPMGVWQQCTPPPPCCNSFCSFQGFYFPNHSQGKTSRRVSHESNRAQVTRHSVKFPAVCRGVSAAEARSPLHTPSPSQRDKIHTYLVLSNVGERVTLQTFISTQQQKCLRIWRNRFRPTVFGKSVWQGR